MRQLINIAILTLSILSCGAQTAIDTAYNYVRHGIMLDSLRQSSVVNVHYYDALGRPTEVVGVSASGNGNDLVHYSAYDRAGRIARQYSATPHSGNGSFLPETQIEALAAAAYGDQRPYSKTIYEQSSLDRPVTVMGAGQAWHSAGKAVTKAYLTNDPGNALLDCRRFTVTDTRYSNDTVVTVTSHGKYAKGTLFVERNEDEDGHVSLTFTDMQGKTVLSRAVDGNTLLDTYYVYDVGGNLTVVLPPKASADFGSNEALNSSSVKLKGLAYFYIHDWQGRMRAKKMPGCFWVMTAYDNAGRPVFTQDGNQRITGESSIVLRDAFGRECVNGLVSRNITLDDCDLGIPVIVARDENSDSLGGYSLLNSSLQLPNVDLLNVFYYDDYSFTGGITSLAYNTMSGFDSRYINSTYPNTSARGMLTGTATRVLDTDTLLLRTIYYDYHENVIQTHEQNLKGGYEHYYYDLTFTGKPLLIRHEHTTADTFLVETTAFTYDNMERLMTVSLTQGDGSPQLLCSNTYDNLGRLASQGLGGSSQGNGSSFAHQADYTYNVRGWLSGISGTKFSQTLHYEDTGSTGATPCFNGNISSMEWTAQEALFTLSPTAQRYAYSYDGLNRLTSAVYGTTGSSSINGFLVIYNNEPRNYSCTYQYDLNGNIKALTRKGVSMTAAVAPYVVWAFDDIDDLTITYNGNQLKKVTDQCDELTYEGAMDFRDGANKATEYSWDANGNMTSDKNRRIHKITYNVLNLPRKITFDDGNIIQHTYAADGRRLRTEYLLSNMQIMERESLEGGLLPMGGGTGGDSPDFLGPGVPVDPINPIDDNRVITLMKRDYCGNHIYRNDSLERVMNDYGYRNAAGHHYYINDYQGNVRAVVDGSGTLEEVNSYYPYGALMGGGIAAGLQPYKYGGKELDRQAGIDWYDSHARWYDSLIGRTPTQDRLAEKYYHLSPYAWCAGNPVLNIDLDGRFWETIWDVGNVIYDVGAALYHHATGNHEAARGNWMDAGADAFATVLPIVPAGATKAVKAGTKITKGIEKASDTKKTLKHANEIKEGREFEKAELNKAIKRGENVSSNARLVPQNGKGNIKGNRTDVDQLIKHDDGTYTIVETKRTASTPLSKGQKEAKMNVEESFGIFEIRTNIPEQNLKKGEKINIIEYRRINKYNN